MPDSTYLQSQRRVAERQLRDAEERRARQQAEEAQVDPEVAAEGMEVDEEADPEGIHSNPAIKCDSKLTNQEMLPVLVLVLEVTKALESYHLFLLPLSRRKVS